MDKEDEKLIYELLLKVKQNKKYSTISDEIVIKEIKKYLIKTPVTNISKMDISLIRKSLHRLYSSYQTKKKNKREKYLEELKHDLTNKEIINKLLCVTVSTTERLEDYSTLYIKIFDITGLPKSITDLGSGLNPLSYPYMGVKKLDYYAFDIDNSDIDFLNKYFEIAKPLGINGKAGILDVQNLKEVSYIPGTDVIFMFKLIDLIDKKHDKTSEELIKLLLEKTKFVVASFSTKTLTRKPMKLPRRKGFELMLERNNLKYKVLELKNEIFYIISK